MTKSNEKLDAALGYAERGWMVIPLHTIVDGKCSCGRDCGKKGGKHPIGILVPNGLKDGSTDPTVIRGWWAKFPDANIGIVTGQQSGIIALDIDVDKGGDSSLNQLETELRPLPNTLKQTTGSGGNHFIFKHPGSEIRCRNHIEEGIDFRADGGYIVASPSTHISGRDYSWSNGGPDETQPASLPESWLLRLTKTEPGQQSLDQIDVSHLKFDPAAKPPTEKFRALLENNPKARTSWEYARTASDMKDTSPSGYDLSLWSHAKRADWSDQEALDLLIACRRKHGISTNKFERNDYVQRLIQLSAKPFNADSFNLTDIGNAERIMALHGEDMHYCAEWGEWLVWKGTRWKKDNTKEVERKAKDSVRKMYADAGRIKDEEKRKGFASYALKCESNHRIKAMIERARAENPILPDELNQDHWLLNCFNGTIDLHTGKLLRHRRKDYITKLAQVDFDPEADCPLWDKVLKRIMAGDEELISFLQRLFGYFLTGDISEQIFPIFYGEGANGKSTVLDTIMGIMGDYARKAPPHLVTMRRNDEHPTEIADLFGRRLVVASESEEGKKLRIELVKQMTGDETLTGRFMRQDYFTFNRTHKTVLMTNNKPRIEEVNNAIWRRILLIPFQVTIPEKDQDKRLLQRLRGEWPGILRWAVQGCLAWQKRGLEIPKEIRIATTIYRDNEDQFKDFLGDCCRIGPSLSVTRKDLVAAYQHWAKNNGIQSPMTSRALYDRVRAIWGVKDRDTMNPRRFKGIGLAEEETN